MGNIKFVDLFCGCGGLSFGFKKNKNFKLQGAIDSDLKCIETYKYFIGKNSKHSLIQCMDITKKETINYLSKIKKTDLVIGGPPCQAYSVAGRIRDNNGMKLDYRNYLFESFLKAIKLLKSNFFIMENVPGILSARPGNILITDRIQKAVKDINFYIHEDLKKCNYQVADFGVPQRRNRIIIFGINKKIKNYKKILSDFYKNLDSFTKLKKNMTVIEAIGDLEKFYPLDNIKIENGKKFSHQYKKNKFEDHIPRFHNLRDIKIFKMLAKDIETGKRKYTKVENLKTLYENVVKKKSSVHKYYVLQRHSQSNLIPAHLYKDGLRHIHYDSKQARTLTVREAARLQSFPDYFKFIGSNTDKYKMIGNAVPPLFSKFIAKSFLKIF